MQEVTALEFCFSTPRIIMQKCTASMITPTPARLDRLLDGLRDLDGEPFLDLQAARVDVDEARDLGEADHLPVRQVGDVRLAVEREQVVLAQGVHVDVLDHHHLVVGDGEEGLVQDLVRILRVAAGQEAERLLDALRRLLEALAVGILAHPGEDVADAVRDGSGLRVRAKRATS